MFFLISTAPPTPSPDQWTATLFIFWVRRRGGGVGGRVSLKWEQIDGGRRLMDWLAWKEKSNNKKASISRRTGRATRKLSLVVRWGRVLGRGRLDGIQKAESALHPKFNYSLRTELWPTTSLNTLSGSSVYVLQYSSFKPTAAGISKSNTVGLPRPDPECDFEQFALTSLETSSAKVKVIFVQSPTESKLLIDKLIVIDWIKLLIDQMRQLFFFFFSPPPFPAPRSSSATDWNWLVSLWIRPRRTSVR